MRKINSQRDLEFITGQDGGHEQEAGRGIITSNNKNFSRLLSILFLLLSVLSPIGLISAQAQSGVGQAGNDDRSSAPPLVGQVATNSHGFSVAEPVLNAPLQDDESLLEDGWKIPTNISRSGVSTDPQMVIDNRGIKHVLWLDALGGFMYASGSANELSEPAALELPFATRSYYPDLRVEDETPLFAPLLIADEGGLIHAFWIDGEKTLYYSSVPAGEFTTFASWSRRVSLDGGALHVGGTAEAGNYVHIAYLRAADDVGAPAGVYYRRLAPDGTWSDSQLIDESRYIRAVPAEDRNVQIIAPGGGNLYLVWDDTLVEQIFFARSTDRGVSWDTPLEIDRRALGDGMTAVGPSGISIGTADNTLHLTWQAGHELNKTCAQYISSSADGGETWSLRQHLALLPDCLKISHFVETEQAFLLLGSSVQEDEQQDLIYPVGYLLAWNGENWSDPQLQEALSAFINPETNQPVFPSCLQAFGAGVELQVLACDVGSGQDIWFMTREIADFGDWFPPPPIWQGPEMLNIGDSNPSEVKLVSSDDGNVHAFWMEENSPLIFLSSWDDQWAPGRAIARSPQGAVTGFDVTATAGRLFLTWTDDTAGMYFSQANTSDPFSWSAVQALSHPQEAAASPSILADETGNISIAYAIQLNEPRGIYLVQSTDLGATWSDARRIFDGAAANWEMVDAPQLKRASNGQMHLLWSHRALPPENLTRGLAYSRSDDNGQNWSEAIVIIEGDVPWNRLVTSGERTVNLLRTEEVGNRQIVWHRVSQDGGLSWQDEQQAANLNSINPPATAVDTALRLHLLSVEGGRLQDYVWDNASWQLGEGLDTPLSSGGALAGSGSPTGMLFAAYAGILSGESGQDINNHLFAMSRNLELPGELPTPLPTLTPTPQATGTPAPSPTPWPTSTPLFSTEQDSDPILALPGLPAGSENILLGILPAAIIVIILFIVGIWIVRKR